MRWMDFILMVTLAMITGTFGQVLECWDRKSKDLVAIEIIRGLQNYSEASMIEVYVIRKA